MKHKERTDFHFIGIDKVSLIRKDKIRKSINDPNIEVEERYFNPYHHLEYLKNERYHHSDKGCEVEMISVEANRKDKSSFSLINKFCKTHQVKCSKIGWELGWYGGTQSVPEKTFINTCKICGKQFSWNNIFKITCQDCTKN